MNEYSITQPTYLETFAHVSPYFDNPLLSNGFITRKLVKGEIWKILARLFAARNSDLGSA